MFYGENKVVDCYKNKSTWFWFPIIPDDLQLYYDI